MTSLKKTIYIFIPIVCIFSCRVEKKDAIGVYVSRNNINNIDTVIIQNNGSYLNLMYRKTDNSLVYRNVGKWKIADGYITFENFFVDEDDIHSKDFKNYNEILITTMLPLEKKSGKIIIHHKPKYEHIYLEKIK